MEYINIQNGEILNESMINQLKDNSMLKNNPEIWEIWDFENNKDTDVFKITRGSGKKVSFLCKKCKNNNFQFVKNRTKGIGCPTCRGFFPSEDYNITKTNPDICKDWDYENNKLGPENYTKGSDKKVFWKCEKKHSYESTVSSKIRGRGCPFCAGKKIDVDFNSLKATHPLVADMLVDKKLGETLSKGSEVKVLFECYCGSHVKKAVYSVVNQGFSCVHCKDGFSFGEKVMSNILKEKEIEFIHDSKIFSENKRYDFVIEKLNMIIEIHGEQHRKEKSFFNTSKKEQQENDKFKKQLAIENGYFNYIEININGKNLQNIKEKIINSELKNFINLEDLDWDKVFKNSLKSKILEYVETIKNNKDKNKRQIAEICNISEVTFRKYFKIAKELKLL